MSKQIQELAAKAIERFNSAGLGQGGRARFGSFAEAKRQAQNFAAMVRHDVVANESNTAETREAFLSITGCAVSITFRGWADLGAWLSTAEALLKGLATVKAEDAEIVYVKHHASGRVRRFPKAAPDSVHTKTKPTPASNWQSSSLTVGQCKADIANGSAFECDERGDPLAPQLKMAQQAADSPVKAAAQWVYFVMVGTTGTIRRYDASSQSGRGKTEYRGSVGQWYTSTLSIAEAKAKIADGHAILCNEFGSAIGEVPKPKDQATDPATGISYRVDDRGDVLSRRSNDVSWCAAPCTVRVVQALIRLGLVEADQ